MTTNITEVKKIDATLWRARDCIAELKSAKPAAKLFDEFWREGELALFFGISGKGKSLLAVQIADALARGTPLHGFIMPKGRKKVLYVDLTHSGPQFLERYGEYRFAKNLYRGQPAEEADLFDWIKAAVEANDFQVVIVDDLSAVKLTNEGVRETRELMRDLKRLCRTRGISVLAISDASAPKNWEESEDDLNSSKLLCRFADSVFSISRADHQGNRSRLIQIRSRSGKLFWNRTNAPKCSVKRFDSGLLGFEFDSRFAKEPDKEKCRLINDIHWRHEDGESFRSIAKALGLPTSTVFYLSKKWTSEMGHKPEKPKLTYEPPSYDDPEDDEDPFDDNPEYQEEERIWLDIEKEKAERRAKGLSNIEAANEETVDDAPPKPRSIYDLEMDYDGYGKPVYIQSREKNTGKPTVWFKPAAGGSVTRCTSKTSYIEVEVFKADQIDQMLSKAGP